MNDTSRKVQPHRQPDATKGPMLRGQNSPSAVVTPAECIAQASKLLAGSAPPEWLIASLHKSVARIEMFVHAEKAVGSRSDHIAKMDSIRNTALALKKSLSASTIHRLQIVTEESHDIARLGDILNDLIARADLDILAVKKQGRKGDTNPVLPTHRGDTLPVIDSDVLAAASSLGLRRAVCGGFSPVQAGEKLGVSNENAQEAASLIWLAAGATGERKWLNLMRQAAGQPTLINEVIREANHSKLWSDTPA